jgi:hypothetical protein
MKISDKTRTAIKADGTKIPVVDSKFSTLIQPESQDIKNAVAGDPTKCMYALACRRLYNSELVWITRTRAYVELKGRGGRPELQRFILSDPAMANIRDFDAKKDVSPEAIVFLAPKGKQTLDAQLASYQKRKKQGKAYISGEAAGQNKARQSGKQRLTGLRGSGTGKFQFQHKLDR